LQARGKLVEAKGKGLVQTYWVTPDRSQSVSAFTDTPGKAVGVTGTTAQSSTTTGSTSVEGYKVLSDEEMLIARVRQRMGRSYNAGSVNGSINGSVDGRTWKD
jgi:hypothetical protein